MDVTPSSVLCLGERLDVTCNNTDSSTSVYLLENCVSIGDSMNQERWTTYYPVDGSTSIKTFVHENVTLADKNTTLTCSCASYRPSDNDENSVTLQVIGKFSGTTKLRVYMQTQWVKIQTYMYCTLSQHGEEDEGVHGEVIWF